MRMYWFTLSVLFVWRITHLLQAEDGPWDFVVRLRGLAGSGFVGKLLDCFYCLSLWVAAPLAYFAPESRLGRLIWWPALSAGAILLERMTALRSGVAPALYLEDRFEDKEKSDVMLRTEESTTAANV